MPLGLKPQCFKCATEDCELWHKTADGKPVCNQCNVDVTISLKLSSEHSPNVERANIESVASVEVTTDGIDLESDAHTMENGSADSSKQGPGTRSGFITGARSSKVMKKSGRGRSRKLGNGSKVTLNKGRGRRAIFKKQPMKAPSSVSTTVTSGYLFHHGVYYQTGDIVSVLDEDGGIYYAQIRGLLQDQYCEKSAVLTWLLPTQSSPPPENGFDPHTYILGPEEELPRKLEYLEFIMHSPSEYFKLDVNIRAADERETGFIWTTMGPVRRTIQS